MANPLRVWVSKSATTLRLVTGDENRAQALRLGIYNFAVWEKARHDSYFSKVSSALEPQKLLENSGASRTFFHFFFFFFVLVCRVLWILLHVFCFELYIHGSI